MIITSIITLAAIVMVFVIFERQEIEQQAALGAEYVVESLVIGTEIDASPGNIQRIISSLAANRSIQRLTLINENERIVADNDQTRIGKNARSTMTTLEKSISNILFTRKSERHAQDNDNNVFYQAFRISLIDPTINRLRPHIILLAYDETAIVKKVQDHFIEVTGVIAIGIFIMMSLMYLILRHVLLNPLTSISNKLEAHNDATETLLLNSNANDEIGMLVDSYNLLIGRRQEQDQALTEARKYIDSITEEVPVLLAYVDRDRRYKFVNKNYERWFGVKSTDFLGKKFDEFMVDNVDIPLSVIDYTEKVYDGETVDYDYECSYPVVGIKQIHITYSPDINNNGGVDGFFICVEDISDRTATELKIKEYAKNLEIEKNNAQAASIAKSEFLANMSHELRTPLNSLLILSHSLTQNLEENLTDEQVESAKYIHEGGEELLDLINDLMDLSKVEAGMLSVFKERTFTQDISNAMQRKFTPLANQKNIPLIITVEKDIPKIINTDIKRINQILKNFLSNAFKFTHEGEVKLKIFRPIDENANPTTDSTGNQSIAFSVTDSGIGIAKEKLSLIFEAFQQEDGSTSRQYGGTGLGLTIATKLADLLGGNITLSSTQGVGSTFTFYLPIIDNPEEEDLTTAPSVSDLLTPKKTATVTTPNSLTENGLTPQNQPMDTTHTALTGKRALLVDDDIRNVFALSKELTNAGMLITIADNGSLAVEKAKTNEFDILLMDIMMPVMDGYETTRKIRNIEGFSSVPIIALTANAMSNDREKCIAAGASDYMAKPVNVEQLLMMIEGCLDNTAPRITH